MAVSLIFITVFAVTYTYTDFMRPKPVERLGDRTSFEVVSTSAERRMLGANIPQRSRPLAGRTVAAPSRQFTFCHTGGGVNCVVDGDTAWIDGVKVRIADIDAPETHPPRCEKEAKLGARATKRLAELMNMGPFEQVVQGREQDRYGRQLRVLVRDGRSLGEQLVTEGLARRWDGARRPWC